MSWDGLNNGSISINASSHERGDDALWPKSRHEGSSSKPAECANPILGAAISNVPPEILSEIFLWCCPTYNDRLCGSPFSSLMLSHVCQSWRDTAFQTPGLWTYMKLIVQYSTDSGMKRANDQLNLWLTRVQNCPILIDAEFVDNPRQRLADNVFQHVKNIIDMILVCKRSLVPSEMELRAALDATAIRSSSTDRFPRILEQYSWAKSNMRPDRPLPGSVQIHVNRYANIVFGLEGHSTLGSHLMHLDLRDAYDFIRLSVEECQIALTNFPHLEYCALRVGESTDEVAEPVMLMHLRTLSLSWTDGVEIASLLDSILAPALGELELRGSLFPREYFPENHWSHLRDFLHRSSPQLWALTLGKMDCTGLDLLSCLALCEGLQHLSLEECKLDEEIMTMLRNGDRPSHDQARRTLMGLDFLALVSCDIFSLDEFLRSSINPIIWSEMSLSRLYIIGCGHISGDVLAAMKELPLEQFESSSELSDDEEPLGLV